MLSKQLYKKVWIDLCLQRLELGFTLGQLAFVHVVNEGLELGDHPLEHLAELPDFIRLRPAPLDEPVALGHLLHLPDEELDPLGKIGGKQQGD